MKKILWGCVARIVNLFVPVKQKHWAFSADKGLSYREGSKYLLEYMLKTHPEYKCTFFTMNKEVVKELEKKGIPCLYNFSMKAIFEIARCEAVFTTQTTADIRYAFKKKGRSYYYLLHGMSFKKSFLQLPTKVYNRIVIGDTFLSKMKNKVSYYFTQGYKREDVSFVSACSDFLAGFMRLEFPESTEIKILGMPRNDALFDRNRMNSELWLDELDGKFVITYMPTHRNFGEGMVTPTPFKNRPDIQKWMKENNVVLLMKNHPNMIPKIKDDYNTDVIKDITKLRIDPQVCIYFSDILITDCSSVWMDYLLLKRPIIFYSYDNFEEDDVGTYYDVRKMGVGETCYDEQGLFDLVKKIKKDYCDYIPADEVVHKYHLFADGNSCERYYNAVKEDLLKKES